MHQPVNGKLLNPYGELSAQGVIPSHLPIRYIRISRKYALRDENPFRANPPNHRWRKTIADQWILIVGNQTPRTPQGMR